MNEELTFKPEECKPSLKAILECQSIPADAQLDRRISDLIERAQSEFEGIATPRAILADISQVEFSQIYRGVGENEPVTPVAEICPKAEYLALFALTVGAQVSKQIEWFFSQNDFALGSMLDSVASASADRVADLVERHYLQKVTDNNGMASLRFSPGYCGWHVSGQRALFDYLQPEQIGITLRPSSLMEPLKSISGVVIVGKPEIFAFDDSYDFCTVCRDHSCRDRQPTRLTEINSEMR